MELPWRQIIRHGKSKFLKNGFHGGEVNKVCIKKNVLKTVNKRAFTKANIMGTGASSSSREWTVADEDNATVEDVRPRTAANANLPANDGMTGMTKVVEAKNRFLKIKNKEKNTACFQKQVRCWVNYVCLWNRYMSACNLIYSCIYFHSISVFFYLFPNRTWNFVTKIFCYWFPWNRESVYTDEIWNPMAWGQDILIKRSKVCASWPQEPNIFSVLPDTTQSIIIFFTTNAAYLAIWLANLLLYIRVHTTLLPSMCHAMPFSAHTLKKTFSLTLILW